MAKHFVLYVCLGKSLVNLKYVADLNELRDRTSLKNFFLPLLFLDRVKCLMIMSLIYCTIFLILRQTVTHVVYEFRYGEVNIKLMILRK